MLDAPKSKREDPEPTPVDKDCAYFVRDALFPLERDWGSSRSHHHSKIHPALMALDRLRLDLIGLRPKTTSFSNIFPRGVLLVNTSDALAGNSSSNTNFNEKNSKTKTMEYNGQPDVDESTASVEIIPNLLTAKCMRCSEIPFLSKSLNAFFREKHNPWKSPDDTTNVEYELVVCSDRILQSDYYRTFGQSGNARGGHRREDLPVRSMKAVEEVISREITKLQVHSDDAPDNQSTPKPPISYDTYPASSSEPDALKSCENFARLELLAAKASDCLLERQRDETTRKTTETRLGSALFPKPLFSVLPLAVQRNFVDRCTYKVASQHTYRAASNARKMGDGDPPQPKECIKRAWASYKSQQ